MKLSAKMNLKILMFSFIKIILIIVYCSKHEDHKKNKSQGFF